jgi:hypothetical protein
MKFIFYFFVFMTTELFAQNEKEKKYIVTKIQQEIPITGKGDNPQWQSAIELSDFSYPWEHQTPPITSFRALHNQNWLYCLFQVKDDNVQVFVKSNDKLEVGASDRVELFFRKDDKMSPYYGLEIDPKGRIFDYEATHYRQFSYHWTWPAGQLVVGTTITKDGYTAEIAISKKSLIQLGLLKGNLLEAGLFRANCIQLTDDNSQIKWISWMKPNAETPDFHIPSAFGILKLRD